MKPKKLLAFIFIEMFFTSIIFAQEPLDYFPHHLGDIWEYWVDAGPGGFITKQNEITKDSLGNDGRYYIESSWLGKFVVDTTTLEVFRSYGTLDKLYKLDADTGDTWIVWEDSTGQFQFIAVIAGVFEDTLFNQPVFVKVIDYYGYTVGAPESLWTQTHYLASNFGLVREDIELSAPSLFIRGVIIDSILYGTVTNLEQGEKNLLPLIFSLHQNYPNPFNPTTTIKYNLPVTATVELTVYDLLGKKVIKLVNARQAMGSYQVKFNGSDLSSGVYLYRLKINQELAFTRKMILLK